MVEIQEKEDIIDIESKTIYIYGDITEITALKISKEINTLDFQNPFHGEIPITVKINSEGGLFLPCLSIMSDLKSAQSKVIVDITGVAFSAGAFIALMGNHRRISKFGEIMFHSPSFEVEEKLENIENMTAYTREHFNRIMKIALSETKLSFKNFEKFCKGKDWFINPSESLKHGIVNEIY
jgi:ATP-dependent protease ClpP protease subunit